MNPVGAQRALAGLLAGVAVLLAVLAPLVFSDFFVSVILTKALWLGRRGREPDLPVGLRRHGVARPGRDLRRGRDDVREPRRRRRRQRAGWTPWLAALAAIVIATAVGLGFGAIAARSEGIYFLMITLAFSVLVFYFFSQVTQLSGFGGVNNLDLPSLVGNPALDPRRSST